MPDETKTTTENENDTTTENNAGAGFLAADQGGAEEANTSLTFEPDPEREAVYMRQSALSLAAQGGIHEAKEPIKSVLARAEAYLAYMQTGETGIVA